MCPFSAKSFESVHEDAMKMVCGRLCRENWDNLQSQLAWRSLRGELIPRSTISQKTSCVAYLETGCRMQLETAMGLKTGGKAMQLT